MITINFWFTCISMSLPLSLLPMTKQINHRCFSINNPSLTIQIKRWKNSFKNYHPIIAAFFIIRTIFDCNLGEKRGKCDWTSSFGRVPMISLTMIEITFRPSSSLLFHQDYSYIWSFLRQSLQSYLNHALKILQVFEVYLAKLVHSYFIRDKKHLIALILNMWTKYDKNFHRIRIQSWL